MACRVGAHPKRQHLYLRLWWRGRETWERTGRPKTKANREELARIAALVTAEIRAGVFTVERYLHYFPDGARRTELEGAVPATPAAPAAACPTLGEYYSSWITRFEVPGVRPSRPRDYRLNLVHYVLPRIGHLRLDELRTRHLRDLRTALLGEGLGAKTVKNIIGSSLRALVRDAIGDELLGANPFLGLEWERTIRKKPDPFTADERDRLLGWFAASRRWYYPFVFTLFHTGMRPSEATALRFGDVDLGRGTVDITKSRHLGAEHPPKTSKSERTIKLPPAVVAVLRELIPLHVDPTAYLFTNAKNGGPIDQSEFAKTHWQSAIRAKAVKPRKFYATRSTFISLTVPKTRNLKALADYCGTSVAMIEQHYGRYMGDEPDWLEIGEEPTARAQVGGGSRRGTDAREPKPVTPGVLSLVGAENPLWNEASPTGFEPVLPT